MLHSARLTEGARAEAIWAVPLRKQHISKRGFPYLVNLMWLVKSWVGMVLSVGVLFRAIAKQTTTKRKELPWMCHCVRFSTHAFFHGKHMPPTPLSATRPDADWHSRPQICLSCLSTQCRAGPTHLQPLVFRHRLRHVVFTRPFGSSLLNSF